MTPPVIICCVKALYDFQSTDPSSLTFKKDDEIDVLAQLESGWWDGWCNGERGWFPCNYVQVVEVQGSGEDSDEPEKETDEEDDEEEEEGEEEDELDAAQDGRLAQRIAAEVKDPWIPQTTPDGIIFYFNTQTRVSSWDVPLDDKELLELQAAGERDEAARRANTATPDAASGASSSRGSFPTSASSDRASTPRASTPRASTPRAGSPSQERVRCGSKTNGSGKANGTANGNGHHRYSRQQANGSPAPGAGLPVDWVLQQTEDGIGHYYYNTVTEEMRWEHPLDRAESRIDTFMDSVSISDDDVSDEIDEAEKEKEVMEEWSKRDEDAAEESETEDANSARRRSQPSGGFADNGSHNEERKSFASSSGSRLGDSVPGAPQKEINAQLGDDIENGEKLPPNWVKKNTAQGRPYYYNVVTQEKTWTLENVDMETGEILSKKDRNSASSSSSDLMEGSDSISELPVPTAAPQPLPRSPSRQSNGYRRKNLLDPNEPLTWPKLAANIALAIHNLNTAAKNAQRNFFVQHASAIVESIRLMLYASGTIEKESPHIKDNRTLKNYHRAIMASLSKLVLSAKLASGAWPPPDAILKMQSDANEVLVAAREFVNTAQPVGIEVRHVDPRLVPGLQNWRQRNSSGPGRRSGGTNGLAREGQVSRYSLQQDLHNNLDFYARGMTKSLTLLVTHARNAAERPSGGRANSPLAAATPLLIAQFRSLSTQISQFINIVEDIAVDDTLPSVGEFRLSKQSLYTAVGLLFNATQNATDRNAPESVSKVVDSSVKKVEESLWDVCDSVKGMILERQEKKFNVPAPAPTGPAPVPEGYRAESNKGRPRYNGHQSAVSRDISRDGSSSMVDTVHEEEEEADSPHFPDIVSNDSAPSRSHNIYSDEDDPYDDGIPDESTEDGSSAPPPANKVGRTPRRRHTTNEDEDEIDGNISSDTDVSQRSTNDSSLVMPAHLLNRKRSDSQSNSVSSEATLNNGTSQRSIICPPGDLMLVGAGQRSPRGAKLARFFGVDTVETGVTPRPLARDEKHWYLGYDYAPMEIVFNMEGYVKGGTLSALVERLTLHDYLDSNFIATFLLTYRSFCTTEAFFNFLVARFTIEPPAELNQEELEIWEERKRTPVRLRVFSILKNWIENYYNDDSKVLEDIRNFAATTMQEKMTFASVQLIKLIDKSTMRKLVPNTNASAPPPMLPKSLKRFRFLDLDPLELGRQLTIMDSRLYVKIKPVECLNKAWSREDAENEAVNVKACIEYHNQVTAWVSDSILSQTEVKKRTAIIKHWVQVAEKCRILNNFNTCMAILASFDSSAIGRLKRTWETVTQRTMQTLAYIRKLMGTNKNFTEYREIIHSINPPCIPFLGIYLQDLTFIEDGNTNFLKKSKILINFSKRMKTAEVIRDIQQYQSVPYLLQPVQEIQVFIKTHLTSSRDDVTLYELSLQLEPREREDEKIARLLTESGFL